MPCSRECHQQSHSPGGIMSENKPQEPHRFSKETQGEPQPNETVRKDPQQQPSQPHHQSSYGSATSMESPAPQGSHFVPPNTNENNVESRPVERNKAAGRTGARGTAAMDPATRQEVARKGGLAVSRNKQHMAEIGRKGGQSVSKNREHMASIGRKGGAASRGGSSR